jgi:hypothetical protein
MITTLSFKTIPTFKTGTIRMHAQVRKLTKMKLQSHNTYFISSPQAFVPNP